MCCTASPTMRLRGSTNSCRGVGNYPRSEPLQRGPFADPRRSGMIALDQQGETTMVDRLRAWPWTRLDGFLSSDQSPRVSMMLSDLDGFLTAIAIGPEVIMPSEWLPVTGGDDEPVFTDEAQMQAVLGGILSRYNQIRHEIANGTFEPILWSDADGTVI